MIQVRTQAIYVDHGMTATLECEVRTFRMHVKIYEIYINWDYLHEDDDDDEEMGEAGTHATEEFFSFPLVLSGGN